MGHQGHRAGTGLQRFANHQHRRVQQPPENGGSRWSWWQGGEPIAWGRRESIQGTLRWSRNAVGGAAPAEDFHTRVISLPREEEEEEEALN